jgi:hypothetical protein
VRVCASVRRTDTNCGPARVTFQLGGKSYVIRGGSCYTDNGQGGFNIGYVSRVQEPSLFVRGFAMWWTPAAWRPGQRVTVAESSIELRGLREYAGDGTVVIRKAVNGGTFTLVGRSTTGRWAGKRVTGSFSCG